MATQDPSSIAARRLVDEAGIADPRPEARAQPRRPYRSPQLDDLGTVDELLDILGPAQASYGDMGP